MAVFNHKQNYFSALRKPTLSKVEPAKTANLFPTTSWTPSTMFTPSPSFFFSAPTAPLVPTSPSIPTIEPFKFSVPSAPIMGPTSNQTFSFSVPSAPDPLTSVGAVPRFTFSNPFATSSIIPTSPSQPVKSLSNSSSQTVFDCSTQPTLVDLSLPRFKVEGVISMVSLDQKHEIFNIKNMLENACNSSIKFSIENLWFLSLIKYSNDSFLEKKVDSKHILFATMYSELLRDLMVEKLVTPNQLYTWLLDFAKKHNNKKMLWLFTILKNCDKFDDILNLDNELEVFVMALHTFVKYDNDAEKAVENALKSFNPLYKTFLLSLIGASYGRVIFQTNQSLKVDSDIEKLVSRLK